MLWRNGKILYVKSTKIGPRLQENTSLTFQLFLMKNAPMQTIDLPIRRYLATALANPFEVRLHTNYLKVHILSPFFSLTYWVFQIILIMTRF